MFPSSFTRIEFDKWRNRYFYLQTCSITIQKANLPEEQGSSERRSIKKPVVLGRKSTVCESDFVDTCWNHYCSRANLAQSLCT